MTSLEKLVAHANHFRVDDPAVTLISQGGVFKLKTLSARNPPKFAVPPRGKVSEFSRASRKRFIEKLCQIDKDKALALGPPVFVTLTYGRKYPSARVSKKHLKAFLERFRRLAPDSCGFWRLEFQKRGAPHFHLLLFGFPYVRHTKLKLWWAEIIAWDTSVEKAELPRLGIEGVDSWNGIIFYASKYMAKPDSPSPDADAGPRAAQGEGSGDGEAVSLSISHNGTEEESIGRVWGVFNGKKIPYAEVVELQLPVGRWVHRLRRYASRKRKKKLLGPVGFMLFTNNPVQWIGLCLWESYQSGEVSLR